VQPLRAAAHKRLADRIARLTIQALLSTTSDPKRIVA
jgi:hypothetical protein